MKQASVVMLFDAAGNILLLKRSDTAPVFPNQWCFPGGKQEERETASDAALRELKEETGIVLDSPLKLEGLYSSGISTEYTVSVYSGFLNTDCKITLNREHSEHKWIKPLQAAMLDLAGPMVETLISRVLSGFISA